MSSHPRISVILTIHNRTPDVSKAVATSFQAQGNLPDELICVLDRPTMEAAKGAYVYEQLDCDVKLVRVKGPGGWQGPARAWNRGFEAATGDLFYCISSEVVQSENNVTLARELASSMDSVVFGACNNSELTPEVQGAELGVLVNSKMARPLGFIACMPAKAVGDVGGFDEDFMGSEERPGFWYDDDDFYLRMWNSGLNFVFDDRIYGTHLHHERPVLETKIGLQGISDNLERFRRKHGNRIPPWPTLDKYEVRMPGRTEWKHPD